MGLFDLPSPLFTAIDGWFSQFLPGAVIVVMWAALAAFLCMELYRILSPQKRIAGITRQFEDERRRVAEFDGAFADVAPHMRRMLALALRRIALVVPATIVSVLPLLFVIIWVDGRYGATYPAAHETVSVSVADGYEALWMPAVAGAPHARVTDASDGSTVADVAVPRPIPVIHKREWWNMLIGNPAGYLDEGLPFDRIDIALPRQELLPFGPGWLRGWEVPFFVAMTVFALTFKTVRGIA